MLGAETRFSRDVASPASHPCFDPATGREARDFFPEIAAHKAMRAAVTNGGADRRANRRSLRPTSTASTPVARDPTGRVSPRDR